MNSKEKELFGYINGTEKMSGYDGYEGAEGDMSYFDDFNMSYADGDGMSYASGSPAANLSQPYVLQFANTTTNDVTAALFGFNYYYGNTNFQPSGSVLTYATAITNLQNSGISYSAVVAQSQNKAFKIGKWRFQASGSNVASQLAQTVTISHVDTNGNTTSAPMNLSIEKDSYQQQSDILDVTRTVTVDGNTYFTFTLKASCTLVITMFPIAIVSNKAELNGGRQLNTATAPRLSGRNVSPVIIQTQSSVKGITG